MPELAIRGLPFERGSASFSLIHTAELKGVNPFDYLVALIENADDAARAPVDWLPWTYREAVAAVAELAQGRAPEA